MSEYDRSLDMLAYQEAEKIHAASRSVSEERMQSHGGIITEYVKLANLWSTLLGIEISPTMAVVMMGVSKANRIACGAISHKDHYLDASNYFALAWGVHATLDTITIPLNPSRKEQFDACDR